jgi:hypothetical protein
MRGSGAAGTGSASPTAARDRASAGTRRTARVDHNGSWRRRLARLELNVYDRCLNLGRVRRQLVRRLLPGIGLLLLSRGLEDIKLRR